MADRPLSPHLTIWKWGPHMAVSILHRITGVGMATVGLPLLLWWLGSVASGPDAYERFASVMSTPIGWILLVAVTFAIPSTQGALDTVNALGLLVPWIWAESMSQDWAEALLFICVVAQFFCVTASVTSAALMSAGMFR